MWAAATDLPEARQAPAVVLRLTGNARLLMRDMPAVLMRDGQDILDQQGQVIGHRTGLEVLVRALNTRYGALAQETQIFLVSELMTFSRAHNESTDECIARFDSVMFRAVDGGGVVAFNPPVRSWIILTHLKVPRTAWPVLLAPTQGMLPANEPEYVAMIAYIRRNGHLYEHHGDKSKTVQQPYFSQEWPAQNNEQSTFVAWQPSESQAWSSSNPNTWISNDVSSQWSDAVAYPSQPQSDWDNISWVSYSTGQSDDEELTWDDVESIPTGPALNEHLYLAYVFSKRRFRAVGAPRKRFFGQRRKGKGKGKGKFKGKGNHHSQSFTAIEPPPPDDMFAFFKGGKGGKGNRSGNPIDKTTGKQMTCSVPDCNSVEHFWRQCPKKGKGKGKSGKGGKSSSSASFMTKNVSFAEPSTSVPAYPFDVPYQPDNPAHSYLAVPDLSSSSPPMRVSQTRITFMDGSPAITLLPPPPTNSTVTHAEQVFWNPPQADSVELALPRPRSDLFYPWWSSSELEMSDETELVCSYHSRVRLEKGEAVLVDTGALGGLVGSDWVKRTSAAAKAAGFGTSIQPLPGNLSIGGVGTGKSVCSEFAVVPIAFEDGIVGTYTGSIVPESELPALLGFDTLEKRRVLLDCFQGKFYEIGPGGYDISLSSGSRVLHMHKAMTGHPMLPVTEWHRSKAAHDAGESQLYAANI